MATLHPSSAVDYSIAPATRASDRVDLRRALQLSLAAIWLFDGLLQLQTFMFTPAFAEQVLAPSADGNPAWIAASIRWAATVVQHQPVLTNTLFAAVQVALGLGIAWRPAVKPALVASIGWSLLVWWFGEGLGGLLTGGSSFLAGAPGAVLLYAIVAVLVWPRPGGGPSVAAGAIGTRAAAVVWFVVWAGLAALNLQPANLTADSAHGTVAGMGDGQPGWITAAVVALTRVSAGRGVVVAVVIAAVLLLLAVAIALPAPVQRAAVIVAVAVAAVLWVAAEGLGGLIGGASTDVNSGPLLALFAVAFWPLAAKATARPDAVA